MVIVGKDLFGAEPFDPFTCGAADFPPDIQSKLDEMQVSPHLFVCIEFLLSSVQRTITRLHMLLWLCDGCQVPCCAVSKQIDLNWAVKQHHQGGMVH